LAESLGCVALFLDILIMQLVQEVRGILGGMRDARAGCPSQNDDADEQRQRTTR